MIYSNIFNAIKRELEAKYELSSTIHHKGEKGRQREDGLANFLKTFLPQKYGVATGELISCESGCPSPQCDIIIYDNLNIPVIGRDEAVQRVPIEGVYAIIEVKSNITKESLNDTARKIAQIRKMPRHNMDTQRNPDDEGPLFVLFGYKLETTLHECARFLNEAAVLQDVTLLALDQGYLSWAKPTEKGQPPWPLWLGKDDMKPSTLALFFGMLLDSMTGVDLGNTNLRDLLWKT